MTLRSTLTSSLKPVALTAGLMLAGTAAGRPDDPAYYRSLRQAPFAPPPAAFGPAWAIAKLGWSVATVRASRTVQGPDRKRLLALAAVDAAVYVSFSYAYFRRRSPVLAAAWTATDAAVTAVSLPLLARHDRAAAAALLPQAAWLGLATPVAVYQAQANPDPIFGDRLVSR
ncbi:tryptophan-rich sensory protein [Kineosporia sp. J2-2]|uniref:Tryptophan-rich sensory protein n=1 Tax=Kineosporia corallincola TaxID=2835133 RepID=A0ABS5TF09_9ACTN|nr:tryptophan-rich sensory protein [Kineosporia corallincola]MBT0769004.1 tryptophan-rich sensory protein [Kineosporia corallincola]